MKSLQIIKKRMRRNQIVSALLFFAIAALSNQTSATKNQRSIVEPMADADIDWYIKTLAKGLNKSSASDDRYLARIEEMRLTESLPPHATKTILPEVYDTFVGLINQSHQAKESAFNHLVLIGAFAQQRLAERTVDALRLPLGEMLEDFKQQFPDNNALESHGDGSPHQNWKIMESQPGVFYNLSYASTDNTHTGYITTKPIPKLNKPDIEQIRIEKTPKSDTFESGLEVTDRDRGLTIMVGDPHILSIPPQQLKKLFVKHEMALVPDEATIHKYRIGGSWKVLAAGIGEASLEDVVTAAADGRCPILPVHYLSSIVPTTLTRDGSQAFHPVRLPRDFHLFNKR